MYRFRIIGLPGANGLARLVDALATVQGVEKVHLHPFDNIIEVAGDPAPADVIEAAAAQGIAIDLTSQRP